MVIYDGAMVSCKQGMRGISVHRVSFMTYPVFAFPSISCKKRREPGGASRKYCGKKMKNGGKSVYSLLSLCYISLVR